MKVIRIKHHKLKKKHENKMQKGHYKLTTATQRSVLVLRRRMTTQKLRGRDEVYMCLLELI